MPDAHDIRFDLAAREEARQRLSRLREDHLVRLIKYQRQEAEKSTERIRSDWSEQWRLYQSEADFSDKEDWQSQVWIPMPFTATEQATSIIQRSMLDSPNFYNIEGHDARDKEIANLVLKPLVSLFFNKAGFVNKFTDATKVAFATGISLYLKFRMRTFQAPTLTGVDYNPTTGRAQPVYSPASRQFLNIETIPPWNVYRDPNSKPREQWSGSYIMHEEWVDRAFLLKQQRAGIYRYVDQVSQGGGSEGSFTGPQEEATRKGQTWSPSQYRKPVLCTEWYGDVLDENGDLVYPDATMIAALSNDTLLYGPTDNPIWAVDVNTGRRKWPLIGFTAVNHPLRFEGFGILRAVIPLASLFSNLFNLFADGLNWAVNPPTELDLSVLRDWDNTEHYPGKLWFKSSPGNALAPAQIGHMDASTVLAALQYFNQQFENSSFVTSFIAGLPGTRSNITKGEVMIKTNQSMGVFEGMARNIEDGGNRCVELTHDILAQYLTDFQDPGIVDLIGELPSRVLAMAGPAERMKQLSGNFNYLFTGVSAALVKSDMLGRLMQAASLAAAGPYLGLTNPKDILAAIIDALGVRDKIPVNDVPMIPLSYLQNVLSGKTATPPGSRRLEPPSTKQLQPAPNEMSPAVAT